MPCVWWQSAPCCGSASWAPELEFAGAQRVDWGLPAQRSSPLLPAHCEDRRDIIENISKALKEQVFLKTSNAESVLTGLRCMTELLDMTVWSPSIRSSSLRLSGAVSFRLLTELLWELALMDMLGMDWLLPTLFTVPVRPPPGSSSWRARRRDGRREQTSVLVIFRHTAECYKKKKNKKNSNSMNTPPPRPGPLLWARCGPLGGGSFSFCGTASCPALAPRPSSSE